MGVGKAAAERTAEARSAEALWGNLMERKILTVARCPKNAFAGFKCLATLSAQEEIAVYMFGRTER
jgi:hypothetical protein